MSLDQPSRFANWPSIAVRAVLILAVFFGLNWYVKKQKKQQAQQAQQTAYETASVPAPLPENLRDGVVIVFVWDIVTSDEQAWRDAAAASLYHQLQRLTRHAGEHSHQPLRVAMLTTSQKPLQATSAEDVTPLAQPVMLLPADAPSAHEEIKQMLANTEPGVTLPAPALHVEIRNQLNRTSLRNRHVILLTSKPATASTYNVNKNLPTQLHVVTSSADTAAMDQQMKKVLDEILAVAPSATQDASPADKPSAD